MSENSNREIHLHLHLHLDELFNNTTASTPPLVTTTPSPIPVTAAAAATETRRPSGRNNNLSDFRIENLLDTLLYPTAASSTQTNTTHVSSSAAPYYSNLANPSTTNPFSRTATTTTSTAATTSPTQTTPLNNVFGRLIEDLAGNLLNDNYVQFTFSSTSANGATGLGGLSHNEEIPTVGELIKHTNCCVYRDESSEKEEECVICKIGYNSDDILRKIKVCSHSFHMECLDKWFEKSKKCPLCRCDITQENVSTTATNISADLLDDTLGQVLGAYP